MPIAKDSLPVEMSAAAATDPGVDANDRGPAPVATNCQKIVMPESVATAAMAQTLSGSPIVEPDGGRDVGVGGHGLSLAVHHVLDRLMATHLTPGLHIVATPIGNLADITLRALSVLARADVVYCEDTRHSIRLLHHYGLVRPLAPYHEHNGERERPRILQRLASGQTVALISDAGTPLISDPGYKLVRAAREAGHGVWSLPGPSAPIAALAVAGLPTDRFTFEGFLPAKSGARRARLETLADTPGTLVFFEAPQRLADTLVDMAQILGSRPAAVARELTKMHEQVKSGSLPFLADWAKVETVKGEIVILVAPGERADIDDAEVIKHLDEAMKTLSLRDAARHVAQLLQIPRNHVYQLGLKRPRPSLG